MKIHEFTSRNTKYCVLQIRKPMQYIPHHFFFSFFCTNGSVITSPNWKIKSLVHRAFIPYVWSPSSFISWVIMCSRRPLGSMLDTVTGGNTVRPLAALSSVCLHKEKTHCIQQPLKFFHRTYENYPKDNN